MFKYLIINERIHCVLIEIEYDQNNRFVNRGIEVVPQSQLSFQYNRADSAQLYIFSTFHPTNSSVNSTFSASAILCINA